MIRVILVFASAGLLLGACATAPYPVAVTEPPPMVALPPPPPPMAEILAELPANAPVGECFARVVVPGQPIAGPPQAPGFAWVETPGPPGSPGPIWCLVPTAPQPQPIAFTPETYGFIRVLCETDMTQQAIVGIQQQLHATGYYAGGYTGVYDAPTAQAVTQFQGAHHINHGGYLSVQTVQQLAVAPPMVQPPMMAPPMMQQPIYQPPMVAPPVYAQPMPMPGPVYGGGYGYQGGYQGGYAGGGVAVAASASASASAGGVGYGVQGGPYYGTSGYAGYGSNWWSGPGMPGGVGSYPQLPYPVPYENYGPGAAAWPAPGFGPQGYPRPAYAAPTSAVQSGWLTWSGKTYF